MLVNTNFSSPNFSERTAPIEYVILHFTEMLFEDALTRLCAKEHEVSAHYIIKEDGEIFQLVDDKNLAWHAGESSWHGKGKLNQNSIGIELDNLGNKTFSKAQMNSCIELCKTLSIRYNIPKENFIGHSDIAPDRKIDPGIFFDWELLYKYGLGVWHKVEPPSIDTILYEFGVVGKNIGKIQSKLKKLGYKIAITENFDQQTNYIIRAFQSKFCPHIIEKLGIEYYNDPNSKYSWNSYSDNVLNDLIGTARQRLSREII
ncbi:MAG: N-acetylmuramoyl-L-alanine amidase [Rickettsiaceae bacterium]|nr:N-acetylmuramoyl-L-alanine amidase [Rickettsiaceae bacterium]